MSGCKGQILDRLCRELEGMECKKFASLNLRLGMDVEHSAILYSDDDNMISVLLEPSAMGGDDDGDVVLLDAVATEQMLLLVSLTLNDLVSCTDNEQLLEQIVLYARTQWHTHKPTLSLPPFKVLEQTFSGMNVDALEDFGSIPLQLYCECSSLGYSGLTTDEYHLADVLDREDLRFAHEVAIGQRQPRKPLL